MNRDVNNRSHGIGLQRLENIVWRCREEGSERRAMIAVDGVDEGDGGEDLLRRPTAQRTGS